MKSNLKNYLILVKNEINERKKYKTLSKNDYISFEDFRLFDNMKLRKSMNYCDEKS